MYATEPCYPNNWNGLIHSYYFCIFCAGRVLVQYFLLVLLIFDDTRPGAVRAFVLYGSIILVCLRFDRVSFPEKISAVWSSAGIFFAVISYFAPVLWETGEPLSDIVQIGTPAIYQYSFLFHPVACQTLIERRTVAGSAQIRYSPVRFTVPTGRYKRVIHRFFHIHFYFLCQFI